MIPLFSSPPKSYPIALALAVLSLFGVSGCGCGKDKDNGQNGNTSGSGRGTMNLSPENYSKVVSLFYAGNIATETGGDDKDFLKNAQIAYDEAGKLAPDEPAIWANQALLHIIRLPDLPRARQELDKASALTSADKDKSLVETLYGKLEALQLNFDAAAARLRKAIELDADNIAARYLLIDSVLRQQSTPEAQKEQVAQLDAILKSQPDNFIVMLDGTVAAARASDAEAVKSFLTQFKSRSGLLQPPQLQKLQALEGIVSSGKLTEVPVLASQLKNSMQPVKTYLRFNLLLKGESRPIDRFFVLKTPLPTPAAPDTELAGIVSLIINPASGAQWDVCQQVILGPELPEKIFKEGMFKENPKMKAGPEQPPFILMANTKTLAVLNDQSMPSASLPFPGKPGEIITPNQIAIADLDYDFRPDIVAAGKAGLKFYRQKPQFGTFEDVTAQTKLSAEIVNGNYAAISAYDFDLEGDLDLVVAPDKGVPFVLQNNGDGTFQVVKPFAGVADVRGMVWADVDNHGEADIAFLDAKGNLTIFENARTARFQAWTAPEGVSSVAAITVADTNHDGTMEIVAVSKNGKIQRIQRNELNTGWDVAEIGTADKVGDPRLIAVAELDNNGAVDIIVSGQTKSQILLGDEKGGYVSYREALEGKNYLPGTRSDNGHIELYGINAKKEPVVLQTKGTKNYHWIELRPRATYVSHESGAPEADKRINTLGIGGVMEVRAALLYQKLPITAGTLHYGLGDNAEATAIRSIWPNGYVRSELPDNTNGNLKTDQMVIAPYRLGGSCPWLFAWDGKQMQFITDCIWRSPLGLKINAEATAGVTQTEDWIKLRRDQLAPKDGYYDLSICAELWETHFFDYLALMEIDHPAGTEIYVDERFVPNAQPKLAVHVTTPAQPVSKALGTNGEDVTALVSKRDFQHLDDFQRGEFQGIAKDHWVEVEIPANTPKDKPLYLIANGWIHPTDSSINVALSQGKHDPPRGLSIEIPDGKGGWKVGKPGLGFPEGKVKTVVIEIGDLFASEGKPRKLRIRTNLEIYWDFLGTAQGLSETLLTKRRLAVHDATLRHRGFSTPIQGDVSTPEIADYSNVSTTAQTWLDLEGYYTRFGDVTPLLTKAEDRYVIMNAGDEMKFRFKASPAPSSGKVRDYILVGDGWVKDGNFNTAFSRTVLPLPYHGRQDYSTPPTTLEADAVYKNHSADWQTYHTRYVRPQAFLDALRPNVSRKLP